MGILGECFVMSQQVKYHALTHHRKIKEGCWRHCSHVSPCPLAVVEHRAHLSPLCARLPRQGSLQSTGQISGLQSILCLVPASTIDVTLIPVSTLYAEPWSPSHPCSKCLPRNLPCTPSCLCRGDAAGEPWVPPVRQEGLVDQQAKITELYSSGEMSGS